VGSLQGPGGPEGWSCWCPVFRDPWVKNDADLGRSCVCAAPALSHPARFAISTESTLKDFSSRRHIRDACDIRLQFALTGPRRISKLAVMVVHLKAETESRLRQLAETTGRAPDELVEDAMTGYLAELSQVRDMLDGRYDDLKSGRVQPIDGEAAFARLRQKSKDRRGA